MGKKDKQRFFEQVELLAGGGEGHTIARVNGKVVFVKYGAPGDVADIQVVGRKKRFDIANITLLHKPSEHRVEPFCEYFGVCGGCKWQHIAYSEQLKLKDQWSLDCLQRIGKIEVKKHLPIIGSPKDRSYRNKMEYTFSNKRWLYEHETLEGLEHTNALGFHAPGRFDKVIDIDTCWLQNKKGNEIRNFVRSYALENDLSFYDLREHTGFLRNIMLRNNRAGEWMVNVILAEDRVTERLNLLTAIKEEFRPVSLNYAINTKLNDSIYDLEFINFSGEDHIREILCGLSFEIHPKSFFQTNTEQAEKLYDLALQFANLQGNEVVYDLYCGTGTITLAAAKRTGKVIGLEIIEEAIESAKRNAQYNEVENACFEVGDMKDVFNEQFYQLHGKPDLIITDPPRSGMHPNVVKQLLEIACERIVYVSCNPATQARDLQLLSEKYDCLLSGSVDMFPQTHHVENVVLLRLKGLT